MCVVNALNTHYFLPNAAFRKVYVPNTCALDCFLQSGDTEEWHVSPVSFK